MISRRRLVGGGALLLVPSDRPAWAANPSETLGLFRPKRLMMAPDFTVPGLASSAVRLRDFKGQVILLNFWATWCPPCRKEMPSMERAYRRFKARGFTILALSIDRRGEEVVGPFVKSFGLTFPVGLDANMAVATEYRMAAVPTSILIDQNGRITAVAAGARDWDSPAAHQVIAELLRG
ncbi:MAG: peroxiredoxin family protein [Candidatus Rokuibacteriota bacterium]